jgi:hypothetical protein
MVLNELNLKNHYSETIRNELDSDSSLIPYFVTMNFVNWYPKEDRNLILSRKGISKLREYHSTAYRYIISNCMNNFTRKHHLYPKVYSFIDFEGTKENPNRIINYPEKPHLHDIWLVPDQINMPFVYMQMDEFSRAVKDRANPYLRQVQAVLIKDPVADMATMISYSGKFVTGPQGQMLQEKGLSLTDQLPIARSERKVRGQPDPNKRKERFHDDPIGTFRREQKRKIREFYRSVGIM